jgi:hypothetical protein
MSTEQMLVSRGFDFAIPEILTPGGLAIISHSTVSKKFNEFLEKPEKRFWFIRGDLGGETLFPPCFKAQPSSLLIKSATQDFVNLHRSRISNAALSFRLIANNENRIIAFGLQVEAESPIGALEDAREPFGELLDSISSYTDAPLRYIQFSVAEDEESQPLAFEVHLPYHNGLLLDAAHFEMHPVFSVADAIMREGICSESPYYRLLCAYRVKEGIDLIRNSAGKFAASLGKQRLMPKEPQISASEILKRGARLGRTEADQQKIDPSRVFNLTELFNFWDEDEKRNVVAHISKKATPGSAVAVLRPSIGTDYRDFSSTAAILLYYAGLHLRELKTFAFEQLEPQSSFRISGRMFMGLNPKYQGALFIKPNNPERAV